MNAPPTPGEILDNPEVAALAVLETALHVTKSALVAGHPDLDSPEDYLRHPALPGSSALLWTLLTLIDMLSGQLGLYRNLLAEEADPDLSGNL
jgi:hypothetical protein